MNTLQLAISDKLAVITLDRGRSNPINVEMIAELTQVIKSLEENNDVAGVILAGKENFFSSGVDLIEVYDYDEHKIKQFWVDLLDLQTTLFSFKKPMVAAITGHSPAGGCVLAICCDYRVMAQGKFIIGLNEVPVGIIVPETICDNYAFWIGKRKAYQYLLEGKLLTVDEALRDGLIDEVCESENVMEAAERKIRAYMKFNAATWSQSKLNLRGELIARFNADKTAGLEQMLKQWWAPETRQTLQAIIYNLKNPPAKKA
ncbi:MAG TPA: enoyl-CoA hydratase/isomerase family protein [Mucilaginibacter sp.]|jgi:enoyl-CoA hydratase/carnithine racemase|nr:enoyl-CoA hydratase/isomerase family protein [Mucilaginibacter sp.]